MPRIAEFYGILIYMYSDDHPPPHFHAIYGGFEAEVAITSGDVLAGHLPARARRLVREWVEAFREELLQNWQRAQEHQPLQRLPSLE